MNLKEFRDRWTKSITPSGGQIAPVINDTTEIVLVSVDDKGVLHEVNILDVIPMYSVTQNTIMIKCVTKICIVPNGISAQNHGIIYP